MRMRHIVLTVLLLISVSALHAAAPATRIPPDLKVVTNIVFKTVGETKLDLMLFLPLEKKFEKSPLVVYVHGGEMRVIAFIERRQRDVIRKILEHCGLWEEPRAPARTPPVAAQASLELRYEADPDYVPAPEEL